MSEVQIPGLDGPIRTPSSKPKPPTPPPSTKRWTWEYVPADDGKDRRRQTTPELDAELLSQGRRTRRMSKAANELVDTPSRQNSITNPTKAATKRKVTTLEVSGTDTDDDDVIPESVRIAKQRKLRHEGLKPQQQPRVATKTKVKDVQAAGRKKAHVVVKPKLRAVQVPRQKKVRKDNKPNPNVLRACALARAARTQKAKRQVRIAQSAVRDIEPAVNNWQEHPDPAYVYNTEPERRHGIMLKQEFYDPFRQAFSLDFIWPSLSSDTVQKALNYERDVQDIRNFSIVDILPKDLQQSMQERMAQEEPAIPSNEVVAKQVPDGQAEANISASHTATQIAEDLWEDVTDPVIPDSQQSEHDESHLERLGASSQGGVAGHAIEADITVVATLQNPDMGGPNLEESGTEDQVITDTDIDLGRAMQERELVAEERAKRERLVMTHTESRINDIEYQNPVLVSNGYPAKAQGQEVRQNMAVTQFSNDIQARPQRQVVKQDMAGTHVYGSTDDETPNSDELDSRVSWGPEMDEDDDDDNHSCWESEENLMEEETYEKEYRPGQFIMRRQVHSF